ncbi:hypothetical protein [Shewanella maritima]|uniref:hypothetical protein n=1 Tax=Shewanella maritima TaxID=2520507 RepID=UPI003736104A
MTGLDSIYAMLATPKRIKIDKKRRVEQVNVGAAINADSHEAPQSQLPPATQQAMTSKSQTTRSHVRQDDITDDDAVLTSTTDKHKIDVEV